MSEWWSYRLSDFLMFSAPTYYRQFALVNRDLWPLQLLALGAGAVVLACMLRPRPAAARVAFALLAGAWFWVGWSYHLARYADINSGAPWFAGGFALQAVLLAWLALRARAARPDRAGGRRLAQGVLVFALAVYPVLAPIAGRPWVQAEVFAIAPDPTVAASFAVLAYWRAPWPLWILPLAWTVISSATLSTMGAPHTWVLAPLALLASAMAALAWRRTNGEPPCGPGAASRAGLRGQP